MSRDPELEQTKLLLRELILSFTKHGDELVTTASRLTTSISLTVQAHRDDHPKIVGAKGQHITALRTIFDFIGRGIGTRIRVTLLDPAVGEKQPLTPYMADPKWKPDHVLGLAKRILDQVMKEPYGMEAVGDSETTLEIFPHAAERLKLLQVAGNEKNDFANCLHDLFHAIGKSEGRIIHIDVIDPELYANKKA